MPKVYISKKVDPVTLARKYTKRAFKTLISIMLDDGKADASRIAAAKEILVRGWGAPPAKPLVLDDAEPATLTALAKGILEKREAEAKAEAAGIPLDHEGLT